MRVLTKILIGLGSVFLVLILLVVYLGIQGSRFKRDEAPFVKAYVTDLARRWDVADVYDRSANTLLEQADSAEGRSLMQRFRSLGALTSIHDFAMKNFVDGTSGRRGVFDFKADFENGDALVEVTVLDDGRAGPRVLGFYLNGIRMNPGAGGKMTT